MIKLLTPISHLFNERIQAEHIINNTDYLEARERTCDLFFPKTTHYHIDFDLNIGISDKQIQFLKDHVKPREEIQNITFQAARDCENINIKEGIYYPASELIPLKQQINNSKESLKKIIDILGKDRKIGIENNNYYPSGAYDICTSLEYLQEIINLKDCHLLFDVAHALVTCANKDISFEDYSETLLKTKKCLQMHICQPSYLLDKGVMYARDAHEIPSFELTEISVSLCIKYGIKLITVEYYQNAEKLISYLKYIKSFIKNASK